MSALKRRAQELRRQHDADAEKQTKMISFRVSQKEFDEIEKIATEQGRRPTTQVKLWVFEGAARDGS